MDAARPLVARKQKAARQRILVAAAELFAERGFDGVSVSDIAESAEVGRTTFFRHFGDKQEVVFAREQDLLDALTDENLDDCGCAPTSPPIPRTTGSTSSWSRRTSNCAPGARPRCN
jgi:AcrR family transcriptional regulator